MISKIILKNVASYKNETVLETDKKVNLIYGLNGTGKSTFSNYLYDIGDSQYGECTLEGLQDTDKLLVYNQQFIKDNFYETEDIQGVFTLSKENKDVKKVIDRAIERKNKLNIERKTISEEKDEFERQYIKKINHYKSKIWEIKVKYTGGDRELEYCLDGLKGNKENLFRYLLGVFLKEEKLEYSIEDLKIELIDLQSDAQKERLISKVKVELFEIEKSPLLSKTIVGNKDSSVSSLIDELGNSDWINAGLPYIHMNSEVELCPFCQQRTISKELLEKIKGYFDESYKSDKINIEGLLSEYQKRVEEAIHYIEEVKENRFLLDGKKEIEVHIARFSEIKAENISLLQKKVQNPSIVVSLTSIDYIVEKINLLIEKANQKIKILNEKIDHRQDSLDNIKEKFWKLMRKEYDSVISLYFADKKTYQKQSNQYKKDLEQKENDINEQQIIIKEKQQRTVNVDKAIANIKIGLLDIGITDFTIEKYSEDEELYHLKRGNNDCNVFKTLSEGEKMVISFLYFIELCKGKKRTDSILTNKIIVIDDPISSLSHIYIFNIGRIIHNEFLRTLKYDQIFILTHSLYFFYELTHTKHVERGKTQKLIRLCKNKEGSCFVKMKYEEIQNDYQAYWHIIKDEEQSPALIANCMRNIMEYFFNFVEKQDFAQIFQRKELEKTKFLAFNRYMNRESHSIGQNIFDIKEFNYQNFKEAFKLVFEVEGYSKHYEKMMK